MNNRRALIIVLLVFAVFVSLIFKLTDIQIIKSEELGYYADKQHVKMEVIKADRGMIYDRNNVLLVYNHNDVSFFVDLRMTSKKEKELIADKFSKVTGKSKSFYLSLMNKTGKNICLEKKVSAEKSLLLKELNYSGLFWIEDPTRVYQYSNLASHILGYVSPENTGVSGIDKFFNEYLSGVDGSRTIERDAIGKVISIDEENNIPPASGYNLVLTIDKSYQTILEEELRDGLEEFGGTSAIGIVMDPNNGEVLALANINDFNPNEYWKYSDDDRRDKAITDTYEPGSTFKPITLAALLDQNLITENENIFCENGKYKFKGVNISDTHPNGSLKVKEVIEKSSNIGMTKLSQKIDSESLYKYLRGFGFGNVTSIQLPGEVKGSLKKANDWSPITKAFISFGYEISVTPIQMITAYCALINGGILFQPQIVKKIYQSKTDYLVENKPETIRRVISEKTSGKIRSILKGVVENGTGKNASLEQVEVGGKTGTSQKLIDGNYSKSQYNASFVGFFPVDNPQVVIYILVNSPVKAKYGSAVAAPIFKKVAERIYSYDLKHFENPTNNTLPEENIRSVKNDNSKKQNKFIFTKESNREADIMPDLRTLNIRDALVVISKIGIKGIVNGSGVVFRQSITPGTKIKPGSICTIDCRQTEIKGTTVY